jgi:hypothetical protein
MFRSAKFACWSSPSTWPRLPKTLSESLEVKNHQEKLGNKQKHASTNTNSRHFEGQFEASLSREAGITLAVVAGSRRQLFQPRIEANLLNLDEESFCNFRNILMGVPSSKPLLALHEVLQYSREDMGDQLQVHAIDDGVCVRFQTTSSSK